MTLLIQVQDKENVSSIFCCVHTLFPLWHNWISHSGDTQNPRASLSSAHTSACPLLPKQAGSLHTFHKTEFPLPKSGCTKKYAPAKVHTHVSMSAHILPQSAQESLTLNPH